MIPKGNQVMCTDRREILAAASETEEIKEADYLGYAELLSMTWLKQKCHRVCSLGLHVTQAD